MHTFTTDLLTAFCAINDSDWSGKHFGLVTADI